MAAAAWQSRQETLAAFFFAASGFPASAAIPAATGPLGEGRSSARSTPPGAEACRNDAIKDIVLRQQNPNRPKDSVPDWESTRRLESRGLLC